MGIGHELESADRVREVGRVDGEHQGAVPIPAEPKLHRTIEHSDVATVARHDFAHHCQG